jgi:hypothetical protein
VSAGDEEDELERARRRAPAWRDVSPYAGFALFAAVILFLMFVVRD